MGDFWQILGSAVYIKKFLICEIPKELEILKDGADRTVLAINLSSIINIHYLIAFCSIRCHDCKKNCVTYLA